MLLNSRKRRKSITFRNPEVLEQRTLLAAVVDSISIDGQAPEVLGTVNGAELLAVSSDDSTKLFSSDGTQSGTVELSEIPLESISDIQIVGQNLFLTGQNNDGIDLWRTNGQSGGALLVKNDISFNDGSDTNFGIFNGDIYFAAKSDDRTVGVELFKSDGGPATLVSDVSPGLQPRAFSLPPERGAHFEIWINEIDRDNGGLVNPKVIHEFNVPAAATYDALLPDGHYQYWIRPTDGDGNVGEWSAGQTKSVYQTVNHGEPGEFTVFDNQLYFAATSPGSGRELWKSNGSATGTIRIAAIDSGTDEAFRIDPSNFVEFDGQLFFSSEAGLSRTDGLSITMVESRDGGGLFPVAVANGHLFVADFSQNNVISIQSLSSATDTTMEEIHQISYVRGGVWVPGFSRFDSFAVINDELAFLSVEVTGSTRIEYSAGEDRHLLPGDPREVYTKTGTWHFSDGTAAGTRASTSAPFLYSEDDVSQKSSNLALNETIFLNDQVIVVDKDVSLIDGDTVTRVAPTAQARVIGNAVVAAADSRHINSVTNAGVRQENLEFVSAQRVERLADEFWIAAGRDVTTLDSALFRIDLDENPEPGPVISGLESPDAARVAGRHLLTWQPAEGSQTVSSYDFVLQSVTGPFVPGTRIDSIDVTTQTSYERDFDPGQYRIQVRNRFEDGSVSLWSEVFLEVSEPSTSGPVILTTTDEATVLYNPVVAWTADPNAVSYEIDSTVGLVTEITSTSIAVDSRHGTNSVAVRSRFADGTVSLWSNPFEFFAAAPPTVASLVTATGTSGPISVSVRLVETDLLRAVSYDLFDVATGQRILSRTSSFFRGNHLLNFNVPYSGRYRLEMLSTVRDSQEFHSDKSVYEFDVEADYGASKAFVSTVVNGNQLQVNWGHPEAESYDVRLSYNGDPVYGVDIIEDLAGLTSTSRVFTIPEDGQHFSVLVLARNAEGVGSRIAQESVVRTHIQRSTLLLKEGFGLQTTARPTLRWEPPTPGHPQVNRYELLLAGEDQTYRRFGITSPSHTVESDLSPGRHRIFLRAHFEDGSTSPWAFHLGVMDVQPSAAGPTGPPQIVSPASTVSTSRPILGWLPDPAAAHYEVWLSSETGITPIIHETVFTEHSLTLTSDLAAGGYRLWVRTFYPDGSKTRWTPTYRFEIFQSDGVQVTSGIGTQPPGQQTIGWNAVPNAVSYEIYVNEVGRRHTAIYRQAEITDTSHTIDAGFESGKSYEVWVRAHGSDGTKTRWGKNPPILTIAGRQNSTPTLEINGNTASWAAIDMAVQYELWVNEVDPANSNRTIRRALREFPTVTSVDLGLPAGTYRGWVRALVGQGTWSLWSEAASFTIS